MPTGPVRYRDLGELLRREPIRPEYPGTETLIARLAHVKRRGEFSRVEFIEMCRWKSPRAMLHYRRHPAARIRDLSRAVLATRSERRRMELLVELRGVSVPVGSAILSLIDPRRYGVLDIRVWQLLWALGAVNRKPGGRGFTVADWLAFLTTLRHHARRRGVSPRAAELTIFEYHRQVQQGRLYDPPGTRTSTKPTARKKRKS
jgi:hypothetical protein